MTANGERDTSQLISGYYKLIVLVWFVIVEFCCLFNKNKIPNDVNGD